MDHQHDMDSITTIETGTLVITNGVVDGNNFNHLAGHTNLFAAVTGAPYFRLNSANNSLSMRSCIGRIVSGQTDLCKSRASPSILHYITKNTENPLNRCYTAPTFLWFVWVVNSVNWMYNSYNNNHNSYQLLHGFPQLFSFARMFWILLLIFFSEEDFVETQSTINGCVQCAV